MDRRCSCIVPSLLALVVSASLNAEDVSSTVIASSDSAVTADHDIVVTADRQPTDAQRTTAVVDVIEVDDLRRRGHPINLWQALSGMPGVDVNSTGGLDGGNVSIRLRGTNGFDNQILIDGIPLHDGSTTQGQANAGLIDSAGLDRIEVVRGGQSGLYGSNAVGGVVNVLTVRPTDEPKIAARVEGGSFSTVRAAAQATGPIGERLGFAVAVSGLRSDGISSRAEPDAQGASGGSERDGLEKGAGTARIEVRPLDSMLFYVAARADLGRQEYDNFTAAFQPDPDDDLSINRYRIARLSAGGEATIERTIVALDAAITDTRRRSIGGPSTDENQYRSRDHHLQARVTQRVREPSAQRSVAIDRVDLTIGGDVTRTTSDVDAFGAQTADAERIGGGWGQVLVGDRWVEVSQAGRLDQHSREGNNATWRSGLAVFPLEPLKLHAAIGTTFRAPSLYELNDPFAGNANLDAQRARTLEAGAQVRVPGGLTLSSTYFRTNYRRAIEFDLNSFTYQNVDGYRIDGVENGLHWRQNGGGATGSASYTWQRTDLAESEVAGGLAFANLARSKGLLEVGWDDPSSWWALARIELVGRRIAFGGADLPGYAVLGASAGWRIDAIWQVYGRAENLLDKAYEVSQGYATPGRSGYAGIAASF